MPMALPAVIDEHTLVPMQPRYPMSHAPYLAALDAERIVAVWFAGSREWAKDVHILHATRRADTGAWSPIRPLVADIGYSLGNAVFLRDADGRFHVWYVRTKAYWQDGEVVHMTWTDLSDGFQSRTPLPLERGWLVRGRPVLRGRNLYLPVYHETEMVSGIWEQNLDSEEGTLRETMGAAGGLIHPTLVDVGESEFRCFMRNPRPPNRIHFAYSMNRGATWSRPFPTALPNPNSGLDVAAVGPQRLICAYNDSPRDRFPLSLAQSENGGVEWRKLGDLETTPAEFSYPSLLCTDGALHVAYTYKREAVKIVTFDAESL